MLAIIKQKWKINGVNVNNNSINVDNNTQIEIERERETEIEIETEREIENKIEMKSIYPSDHVPQKNEKLDEMMDETDKTAFEKIILQSQVKIYNEGLANEIIEIMKEIYINPNTKRKILKIKLENIDYAWKNFSIANTRSQIQIPKAYFKKCLLSALEQTELSKQFDVNTALQGDD